MKKDTKNTTALVQKRYDETINTLAKKLAKIRKLTPSVVSPNPLGLNPPS